MAKSNYARKVFRKVTHTAGRAIKKRYTTKGKGYLQYKGLSPNLGAIKNDIIYLKSLVNVQKHRYTINDATQQAVGQVSGNAVGYFTLDITPLPGEGPQYNGRVGASIKLSSSYYQFQCYQQANTKCDIRFKALIIQVKGLPQTPSTFFGSIFNPNPFTSIIDYNSMLNPDYFGTYRILRTIHWKLKADNFSTQQMVCDKAFGMRYGKKGMGHHVRFDKDSAVCDDGQILMIVFCDTGNANSSTVSTTSNVANTAVLSGANFNYNI